VLILGMSAQALLGSGHLALGPWLARRRATVSAGAQQRLAA
jgi:hypothetical protein